MIPVPSIFDDDRESVAIGPGGSLVLTITGPPEHLGAHYNADAMACRQMLLTAPFNLHKLRCKKITTQLRRGIRRRQCQQEPPSDRRPRSHLRALVHHGTDQRRHQTTSPHYRTQCTRPTLFVAGQPTTIGALRVPVDRDEGVGVTYLPSYSMCPKSDLHGGEAKTYARDTANIA